MGGRAATHGGATSGDVALAFARAAVVIKGGQAGERGDGRARQGPEFRQVSEERAGGAGTNALDRAEPCGLGGQRGRGGQGGGEVRHDFGVLLFEPGNGGGEILGHWLGQAGDLPCALGPEHGLELFAAGHPRGEFGLRGAWCGCGCGRIGGAEFGEHLGVDPVGLGTLTTTAGEVADLPRIDHREGLAGGMQRGDDGPLPTAGGFADDLHGGAQSLYPGEERRAARRVVGKAPGVALEMEIEGGL